MRKKAKYILASLLMFCFTTSVNAEECSYEKQVELNNLAATVRATYEEVEIDSGESYIPEDENDPDGAIMLHGFKVVIMNITKDLRVTVKDEYTGDSKEYMYSDTNNGVIELEQRVADDVYNYTIVVKGAVEECDNGDLRTINLIVPKYNNYSEYDVCKEYPEFEYCQKYITSLQDISMPEFIERADAYKKNHESETEKRKNNEKSNSIKEFFNKNKKTIIIIAGIIIVIGGATTAILIIRRRSRLI